jgi:hypothetical protein
MGRDRRTYRFLKDTRRGRVVLAESASIEPVADQVALYVAERMMERRRLIDGEPEPALPGLDRPPAAELPREPPQRGAAWQNVRTALALIGAGVLFGLAASAVFYWDRLAANLGLLP